MKINSLNYFERTIEIDVDTKYKGDCHKIKLGDVVNLQDLSTDELTPCPFCSSSANEPRQIKSDLWEITCEKNCSLRKKTKKEVKNSWNKLYKTSSK